MFEEMPDATLSGIFAIAAKVHIIFIGNLRINRTKIFRISLSSQLFPNIVEFVHVIKNGFCQSIFNARLEITVQLW
jgi:hypothetical protein